VSSHLVAVVDDDASVRRALTRLLQSEDLRVLTYASATEFLDTGLSSAPDCVILDIHLGGMTGLELPSRLRESGHRLPNFVALDTPYPPWGLHVGRGMGELDAAPGGAEARPSARSSGRPPQQIPITHVLRDRTIRTGGSGHG
jgi:hypothetical protein